jgi:hypothetical protein
MPPATIAGEPAFIHRERFRLSNGRWAIFHAQKHLELGSPYSDESKSSGLGGWGLVARPSFVTSFWYLAFPTPSAH